MPLFIALHSILIWTWTYCWGARYQKQRRKSDSIDCLEMQPWHEQKYVIFHFYFFSILEWIQAILNRDSLSCACEHGHRRWKMNQMYLVGIVFVLLFFFFCTAIDNFKFKVELYGIAFITYFDFFPLFFIYRLLHCEWMQIPAFLIWFSVWFCARQQQQQRRRRFQTIWLSLILQNSSVFFFPFEINYSNRI